MGKALASICTIVNPLPNCAIDFTAGDGAPVSGSMGMKQNGVIQMDGQICLPQISGEEFACIFFLLGRMQF